VKIIVVGARKSGVYAALLAKRNGNEVFVTEHSKTLEVVEMLPLLDGNGIPYEVGGHSFKNLGKFELAILSPGVPLSAPIVQEVKKMNIDIVGETEFAFNQSPHTKIIAITGTNGKSTTTALTGHILKNAGLNVVTGGNLGTPYSQLLMENPNPDYAVLETSCFQLETIKSFHPYISAFLNFTEDHLDRYATIEEYFLSKKRIFENQTQLDFAILNFDDVIVRGIAEDIKPNVFYFSILDALDKGAFLKDGEILFSVNGNEKVINKGDIPLLGLHNVQNVLVAIVVGKLLNLGNNEIEQGIKSFKGLPHRLEPVKKINDVLYINDSKSTTPDSTIKALESFNGKIVLIAGGSSKNNDFSILAKLFPAKLRKLILMGETANEIAKASMSAGFKEIICSRDLEEAVKVAKLEAQPGDVVLLSPACASFDMFRDFEDRGEQFKEIVAKL
jgi:UDP-N-acetylmuramoylalanine--D-glutamate ligase